MFSVEAKLSAKFELGRPLWCGTAVSPATVALDVTVDEFTILQITWRICNSGGGLLPANSSIRFAVPQKKASSCSTLSTLALSGGPCVPGCI